MNFPKSKKLKSKKQNNRKSTYFPRLNTKVHACINWDWDGVDILKFIKGFSYPYEGAFCYIGQHKIRIFNCKIKEKNKFYHPFMNGLVSRVNNLNYYVISGKEILEIPKKDIKSKYKIKLGDRMYARYQDLLKSKSSRVKYSPRGIKN